MKKGLMVAAALLAAVSTADAQFFTEEWAVLGTGFNGYNAGWDGTYMFVGEGGTATPGSQIYNAADGTLTGMGLDMTGLTFGSLGFFAQTANADGKIFGFSNDDPATLKMWDNIGAVPTQVPWGGGFARNLFAVGDRVYATGPADGGPITINEPDPNTGAYVPVYTFGDGGAGEPGGKAGVTATQDGNMVWGAEAVSSPEFDGIHQWSYDGDTDSYVYDGDYIFPETPAGDGKLHSMDVAVDEDDNLLFAIERHGDKIHAIDLGTTAVGDEVILAEYDLGFDATWYGSLDIDMENNKLYWMARSAVDSDANLGVVSYVPEPAGLILLALGGLLIRRR